MNEYGFVFSKNELQPKKKSIQSNVRKNVERKSRCDKKHDIRIPITQNERKTIHEIKIQMAFQNHTDVSLTKITTLLIHKGLSGSYDFPEVPYQNNNLIVHAKLDVHQYHELLLKCNEWNCSARQAAHRMLMHMLNQT